MLKVTRLLIFSFFLFSFESIGQVGSGIDAQENINQAGGLGNIVRVMKPMKEDTKGSPLLFDKFVSATPFRDGKALAAENFNYHTEENKFLIETKRGVSFLDEFLLDSLVMSEPKRLFVKGESIADRFENMAIEVVSLKGGSQLYIQHSVQFIRASVEGPYAAGNKYDEYIKKMNFFIMDGNDVASFKFNKNGLKSIYPDFADLEKFIKSSNLKYTDYSNQLQILDFMRK